MIEKMKKITLLVSENVRAKFVFKLRKEGVVHVKHVKAPTAHDITFVEDKLGKIEKLIAMLAPYETKAPEETPAIACGERAILDIAEKVPEAYREKSECQENIRMLRKQVQWFETWGAFDPADLDLVKGKGVNLRFYRLSKHQFAELGKDPRYHVIKKEKGYIYLALMSMEDDVDVPFEEASVPPKRLEEIKEDIEALEEIERGIDEYIAGKAASIDSIRGCEQKLRKEQESLEVRFGMQEEGRFSYLQGFCPARFLDKIINMAKAHGLGYLIEDPDDPDETPTHITNPKWVRVIDPVFSFMNTLPGYKEFDISPYFLIFFSIFFAMLIGDAGYGTIFLIATFLIRCKFRKLPWEPFFLMYLLSTCTIIWGVVTGTYFGVEKIAELPVLHSLVIQKINSFTDDNQNFIIYICFIIGAVQLTLAHALRAIRVINSVRALAQVGWILILWGMFFTAGTLVIARPFPPFAIWPLIAGIVMVLFFTSPDKGIIKGPLSTLANLPLSVIGAFSDIVSYLRLFAVGYATVIVAGSFNEMAVGGGIKSIMGGLAAAAILFLGHTLNIILGFMAVIVHGIRLNMLEFSGHLDMQWSGKKYDPFRENEVIPE
jgi:V/A-type H+-transporting ATPase subunit I